MEWLSKVKNDDTICVAACPMNDLNDLTVN